MAVLSMGRRWGKTTLGLVMTTTYAMYGLRVAWICPTYKNGYPLWSMLRKTFAPLRSAGVARMWETDRRIELAESEGGGYIGMYTAEDDCDSMRGDAFDLVIGDEAARYRQRAIDDAVVPTLADRSGKLMLISTPRGGGWFKDLWFLGQDMSQQQVRSFTAPSSANPLPAIQRAYNLARERVSERTFAQEWDAKFIDDGGGVFRGVLACVGGSLEEGPAYPFTQYAIGVDLAKHSDYTVAVVVDVAKRHVVAFDRFNQASWVVQKQRLYNLAKHWNNAMVWIDATGVGDPIYDDLAHAGLKIQPYKFTNASKTALIDNAVIIVEQQQVTFPANLAVLIRELQAYEFETSPAGLIKMSAPEGEHDDAVIAFALACWTLQYGAGMRLPQRVLDSLLAPQDYAPFHGMSLINKTL